MRRASSRRYNSATTLQVTVAVLAGMVWAMENPNRGIVEPDEMDYRRCLEICMPYLGPVVGAVHRLDAADAIASGCSPRTSINPIPGSSRTYGSAERDRREGTSLKLAVAIAVCGFLAGSVAAAGEGYGHVVFANSGAPAAQADFLLGLAMLHDFEYESAAAAFQRAERADPGFALAYWGEAMTYNHAVWMEQDLPAARAALNQLAPTASARRAKAKTEREQGYLDAVETLYGQGSKEQRDFRYEAAMAKLHDRYPDDVDATAFYALAILGTAHAGRDVATYMRAAAVLEEAWMTHRDHPGLVHYLIHSYDDPAHAPLGLRAARIYGKIAPDAGSRAAHDFAYFSRPRHVAGGRRREYCGDRGRGPRATGQRQGTLSLRPFPELARVRLSAARADGQSQKRAPGVPEFVRGGQWDGASKYGDGP